MVWAAGLLELGSFLWRSDDPCLCRIDVLLVSLQDLRV
jgi:hypothetical protein